MNQKKSHRYRLHVECIDDNKSDQSTAITFEAQSHDDILNIVKRVNTGTDFPDQDATALAVGLKLFSGVMLKHKQDPLFTEIQPAMYAFIKNLKSHVASQDNNK
jgi:hypothetical protein